MHVLCEIIGIVKMDDPFIMSIHNLLRQQQAAADVLGHLSRHIVSLCRVDHRIFIGIFLLGFFVVAFNQA